MNGADPMQSEAIDQLAPDLIALQTELPPVPRDDSNDHLGNRFASLAACRGHIQPYLARHGFAIFQGGVVNAAGPAWRTKLVHRSGQWIASDVQLLLPEDAKNPCQAQGSAISYACRYGLKSAVGLVDAAEQDDDGHAAGVRRPSDNGRGYPRKALPAPRREERPRDDRPHNGRQLYDALRRLEGAGNRGATTAALRCLRESGVDSKIVDLDESQTRDLLPRLAEAIPALVGPDWEGGDR